MNKFETHKLKQATGKKEIFLYQWKNSYKVQTPPRGTVWIIHGLGEHMQRYSEISLFLNNCGFDVFGIDLPGHGKTAKLGSYNKLVSFYEMQTVLLDSLKHYFTKITPDRNAKLHLLGHSMGAALALSVLLKNSEKEDPLLPTPIKAFISAPPLELSLKVPAWKEKASEMLLKISPNLKINNDIAADALTHDNRIAQNYTQDKLVHSSISPVLFETMSSAIEDIKKNAQNYEIPLCIAIGEKDPIASTQGARSFYKQLSTHKKYLEFPKQRHEIFNEMGRKDIFKEAVEWFS